MTHTLINGATVWKLHATYGFPIEMSIPLLWDRGMMPTWVELVQAARRDGAKRIKSRLHDIAGDAYPPEIAGEIRKRLKLMMNIRGEQ